MTNRERAQIEGSVYTLALPAFASFAAGYAAGLLLIGGVL
ncbi:hypothetical protein Pla86_27820 [Planctomycetes bacterium Pla86]|uniref:Uncharacterized protein n=1 Tax=Engelhardtia mirabilis TaxID=2528011 RepID=A0A518BL46_9BACT|nr:hypothetical protein Pla133_27830 [Planctomycetes bacterium Pla133]QDV02021.1 hypothetical protein Pla86_27820 [Planctomycetes bacterium Pla86]